MNATRLASDGCDRTLPTGGSGAWPPPFLLQLRLALGAVSLAFFSSQNGLCSSGLAPQTLDRAAVGRLEVGGVIGSEPRARCVPRLCVPNVQRVQGVFRREGFEGLGGVRT